MGMAGDEYIQNSDKEKEYLIDGMRKNINIMKTFKDIFISKYSLVAHTSDGEKAGIYEIEKDLQIEVMFNYTRNPSIRCLEENKDRLNKLEKALNKNYLTLRK